MFKICSPSKCSRKANLLEKTDLEVLAWIEQYVRVLFPENGIEYWTIPGLYEGKRGHAPLRDRLPPHNLAGGRVLASAVPGKNEGRRIIVGYASHEGLFAEIADAKFFGKAEDAWQIAIALQAAFEEVFTWQEQPRLVDFALHVPRRRHAPSYTLRGASSCQAITVEATDEKVVISTDAGVVLLAEDLGVAPMHYVKSMLHDWAIVASAFGIPLVDNTQVAAAASCVV